MKSADFKRGNSKIRVLQEVRAPKPRVNWDRVIYFTILIGSVLLGIFLLIKANLFVRGEGQVLFKKLDIQFTQDIQIVDFIRNEGDSVAIGDTLFLYYDEDALNHIGENSTEKNVVLRNDNMEWITREILMTEKRIQLSRIEIKEINELIRITSEEKDRIEKSVVLDIYPASKLDTYVHRLIDYRARVVAEQEEIRYQQRYLHYLKGQEILEKEHLETERLLNAQGVPLVLKAYTSPVKGTITQVLKEDFEVALESEIVMSIHKPTNLYIKAFYDQKDLRHLREGDVVDVTFPDGTESYGILQRFYFATYRLPDEFQKKYEPLTRSIAADIIPIDEIELEKWRAFYKLNVQISKQLVGLSP